MATGLERVTKAYGNRIHAIDDVSGDAGNPPTRRHA
jgi:hypothetical protein